MKTAVYGNSTGNRPVAVTVLCLTVVAALQAGKLDTLFARGDSSIAITWIPDSNNTRLAWYVDNGSRCTGADSIYRHCDFLPGETYHSIAYSYGGEDGYVLFREKLAAGFLAGSHMCHYNTFGDPSPVVAGSDCSGFVCYLWDVPRVSTNELYGYTAITREELDAGDILVKPGSHAVLIVEREDAARFLIWEETSAVNGCRERSIDITDGAWDAYYPRRYTGLTADAQRAREVLPQRQFPGVAVVRDCVMLHATFGWRGTMALYSLRGELLSRTPCRVENGMPARVAVSGTEGVRIVRLRSDGGDVATLLMGGFSGIIRK